MYQHAEPTEIEIRERIISFNFAVIGWYLQKYGMLNAFEFIQWLGIPIRTNEDDSMPNFFAKPKSPLKHPDSDECHQKLNKLVDGYDAIEQVLRYNFRDKSYLLQSFSHESFTTNDICSHYKSLDFTGDAILNYILVRHLFRDPRNFSANQLESLVQLLISNSNFAVVSVRHQLHKYLRYTLPSLRDDITSFVTFIQRNRCKPIDDVS